jgi:hypothetical protein
MGWVSSNASLHFRSDSLSGFKECCRIWLPARYHRFRPTAHGCCQGGSAQRQDGADRCGQWLEQGRDREPDANLAPDQSRRAPARAQPHLSGSVRSFNWSVRSGMWAVRAMRQIKRCGGAGHSGRIVYWQDCSFPDGIVASRIDDVSAPGKCSGGEFSGCPWVLRE